MWNIALLKPLQYRRRTDGPVCRRCSASTDKRGQNLLQNGILNFVAFRLSQTSLTALQIEDLQYWKPTLERLAGLKSWISQSCAISKFISLFREWRCLVMGKQRLWSARDWWYGFTKCPSRSSFYILVRNINSLFLFVAALIYIYHFLSIPNMNNPFTLNRSQSSLIFRLFLETPLNPLMH